MRTTGLRGFLAAAVLAVAAGALPPAADAAVGRCAPGTGVTVVVDYGKLGQGISTGCDASGAGQNGSTVVTKAGFSLSFVSGEPFVCRIDGLPGPSSESCDRTPPANAYWGLFWSDGKSGKWTYSSQGISSLRLPKGGSIGWRFQDGGARDLPGASPNRDPARAASPSPRPSPRPSPHPSRTPSVRPTPTPSPAAAPTPTASSATPSATPTARPAHHHHRAAAKHRKRAHEATPVATPAAKPSGSPSSTTAALADTSAGSAAGSDRTATALGGAAVVLLLSAVAVISYRRGRG